MDAKIKMPTPRVVNYWLNQSIIAITGGLLIWKGPTIFSDQASPATFRLILIVLTAVMLLVMFLITHRSRGNTLLTAVLRSIILAAISLGLTYLTGSVVINKNPSTTDPEISSLIDKANILLKNGDFKGAQTLGLNCVEIAQEKQGIEACNRIVADADYNLAKELADSKQCVLARETLSNGLIAAGIVGDSNLVDKINERSVNIENICYEPPTPTPLPDHFVAEILRTKKTSDESYVDVRVLNNSVYIKDFEKENFKLLDSNNSEFDFTFEAKQTDDPVCVVVVVDNSGSIKTGIEDVKSSLQTMNDLRKPEDEYGLVVFGDLNKTEIVQLPDRGPVDISKIDGLNNKTALWQGIELGFEALESCESTNKYLVLISDGDNNVNYEMRDQDTIDLFKQESIEEDINFCPIGVSSPNLDPNLLKPLAEGCTYEIVEDFDGISSKLTSIIGYTRDFYRLRFTMKSLGTSNSFVLQLFKGGMQVGENTDVTFGK